jgi:hypothetical protein
VPNDPVDMSSWGSSACYPRRTFYPLSDGPSTWDHRITMTDFRLTVRLAYAIALSQTVSDRPEPTIARLRYSLGGDRPSQTTRHAGSLARFHWRRLDLKKGQGGISLVTPRRLAPTLQSLPPILHKPSLRPLRSCSKGARGLSV